MEYAEVTVCQFVPSLNFGPVETKIFDAEISKLFNVGVFVNTTREPNNYVSGIFTRSKKDGKYGMIPNLRKLFFKSKCWKLGSVQDALDLITECCYFGSIDLKEAYYSIPNRENY